MDTIIHQEQEDQATPVGASQVPPPEPTMPVTLLFTAAQLCMVAKCMEVDRAVTVGEWAMQEVKESTIETLVGCFGAKRAEARALWDGKEEA